MIDKIYVPGAGPIGAKLMILGEMPSYEDQQSGKLFSGGDGRELFRLCKDAGINRDNCWISAVSKYMVPPNIGREKVSFFERAQRAGIDINQQLMELQVEISSIQPNVILALGGTALWALSGKRPIGDYRGSIMYGMGRKFVSTYNPAGLRTLQGAEFKGYWNRSVMICDFKRALLESQTPEMNLPQRTLQICHNSAELYEFLKRYKNKIKMSADVESGGHCIPICMGLAFNKHHGMCVPLWNEEGISSIPDSDLVSCWILLADVLYEKEIIGQNFNYDRNKIKRLGFIIRKLISDTMYKAFAINPELPKNLAFNTSIYTREPFYKNEGMYEGSIQDLFTGCARDACVTYELDEAMDPDLDELGMRPFYENFLLTLPDFYAEIENNGFHIDTEKQTELIKKYVALDEKISYELFQIAGVPVNVNAHQKIFDLLFNVWHLPTRKGTGEEELTALLNMQTINIPPEQRRALELILEGRQVRKTITTYLMAIPDYDGKMKTTCFPCLETGRSSNGQQEPPIRPKVDIVGKGRKNDMKPLGMAFQTITKHGDIGADIRSMFLP